MYLALLSITQNSELRTQNSELRTQNSELKNSELRTQNSELKTQNSELYPLPICLKKATCEATAYLTRGYSMYTIPYSWQACLMILLMAG
jgi:hypothetical protein